MARFTLLILVLILAAIGFGLLSLIIHHPFLHLDFLLHSHIAAIHDKCNLETYGCVCVGGGGAACNSHPCCSLCSVAGDLTGICLSDSRPR